MQSTNPMRRPQTFAIRLRRLAGVDGVPGLILLSVDGTDGTEAARKIGALTDVALRGRLAHFDLHSANELAAVRKELAKDRGRATVYESWPGLTSCVQFWHGFVGSQIKPMEWTCDKCGTAGGDSIGGSVGESFLCRCKCGQVNKIAVPK